MNTKVRATFGFSILMFVLTCIACQTAPRVENVPLLAQAPAEINPSSYRPSNAFEQLVPGLLVRVVYSAENPADNYIVDVLDFLVGPNMTSEPTSLGGDTVMEVRAGDGIAMVDGEMFEIETGTVFSLSGESMVSFENKSEMALQIRAHVVKSNNKKDRK